MGSPLHVTPLGSPEGEDTVLREDVQTERVYALLVDDNEILFLLLGVDGLVAHEVFQLNDLLALRIREPALGLDQLFPLFSGRVEEARVDLARQRQSVSADSTSLHVRFLVFQADVQSENVCVLDAFGHIRMPRTMIQDQTADELRFRGSSVLHLHDLHHVQVDRLPELVW